MLEVQNKKSIFLLTLSTFSLRRTKHIIRRRFPGEDRSAAIRKTRSSDIGFRRNKSHAPDFRIETSYPFGLLRKFRIQNSLEKSLVYPALVELPTQVGLENQYMGEILSDSRGESGTPYGIRDFVYGDAYRFIHWRSWPEQDCDLKELRTKRGCRSRSTFAEEVERSSVRRPS